METESKKRYALSGGTSTAPIGLFKSSVYLDITSLCKDGFEILILACRYL